MDNFLFAGAFLKLASKGSFFRKVIAIALRVIAVLLAIGGAVLFVEGFKFIMQLPSAEMLGGIIFEVFLIVAVYIVVHILWIRAGGIGRLPESEFNVIPIVALLVKMWGEVYAGAGAVVVVGAGIFMWFAGPNIQFFLQQLVPMFPNFAPSSNQSFEAGLMLIIYGLAICFSVLVISYFVSEMILLGVQIERNTHPIPQIAGQYGVGDGPASTGQASSQPAAPAAPRRCASCGAPIESGSRFCESCGATLQ